MDDDINNMLTNPIFISPTNRNIIVTNAAYDYLHHRQPEMSIDNPMYSFSQEMSLNNPMYSFSQEMSIDNQNAPQLPLKVCQKDMVRKLANEDTSELYGNVAEAKNVVIHDLNV
jgi:hypothetical protein